MRIQTFSIVIGTRACDACCPFCVSKMTGFGSLPPAGGSVNWQNFCKACRLAQIGETTTVLLTGKGEPTLYPEEIGNYLEALKPYGFPFIELQTNAMGIGRLAAGHEARVAGLTRQTLRQWQIDGLNTIAVSAVDTDREVNAGIYGPDYPQLDQVADYLHGLGFSVRLCLMMMRGAVDCPEKLFEAIEFCRDAGIEQITARPIRRPRASQNGAAAGFIAERGLTPADENAIRDWTEKNGTRLMSLMHGAVVYDVRGQNFCLSDCLTVDPASSDLRSLIFYSDGRLSYDWQHDGGVILGGRRR
jgi:hypothetical protein